MGISIYNTLTRQKEEFQPIHAGKVNYYACGITVYDMCHIGHARSMIVADVVFRHLERRGFEVNFVRNFTDVDDKIIRRANESGVPWNEVSEKYIGEFYVDMDALGIRRPTQEPRATQYIEQIVEMVETLVKKKHAYAVDGDVFFKIDSFGTYGRLSNRDLDEMEAGSRVMVDKRKKNPYDFALWKSSKPGEPAWDSPWGKGRPGWHIECSAMSTSLCGPSLDIHAGGRDLVFPHHENEIAQSEAATGQPFVKYWLHVGFLNINSEKMSKSLGNFFTIRDVLAKVPPEALRHFLLGTHYRKPVDYSDPQLEEARLAVERLYTAWETMDAALEGYDGGPLESAGGLGGEEADAFAGIDRFLVSFEDAMDDDFNTARAMGYQFELAHLINALAGGDAQQDWPHRLGLLAKARDAFFIMNDVLGTLIRPPAEYRQARIEMKEGGAPSPDEIEDAIARRARARAERNWAEADRIRDELLEKGVVLKDSKDGTTWSVQ